MDREAAHDESGGGTLAIPGHMIPVLRDHLASYVSADRDALILTGDNGGPLYPHVLQKLWNKARVKIGRPELHSHDLRHTRLTLYAAQGATIADLMRRGGHTTPNAALRYQHASSDRDRAQVRGWSG